MGPSDDEIQQVSRSEPSILTLQPAPTQPAQLETATPVADIAAPVVPSTPVGTELAVRPAVQAPVDQSAIVAALAAAPPARPAAVAKPTTASEATGIAPTGGDDEVMTALRKMSLGIVQELQKPNDTKVSAPEPVQAAVSARTYEVKQGDSLPGISFRFYGTTVGYLQILEANKADLPDPSKLQAGMILAIPDLN
jgi:nucleoid-associated protein YgaU